MASVLSGSGNYFSRTTNLPTIDGFTFTGWWRNVSDLNVVSQIVFELYTDVNNFFEIRSSANGTSMNLAWRSLSTSISADSVGLSAWTVGAWQFVAFTVNAAAINGYVAIATAAALSTFSATATGGSTWFTPTNLRIGQDHSSNASDAVAYNYKLYQAVLTQAEIEDERWSILPKRTANLVAWHPFLTGTRTSDYSGNARTLTENGTVTEDSPPPLGWGGRSTRIVTYTPPAGGTAKGKVNSIPLTSKIQGLVR